MIIEKLASEISNYSFAEYYYSQAREGMHDVIKKMHLAGLVNRVYIPGYIGWSPKEGSGIFDSIASIEGIELTYYKMTSELYIDVADLFSKISGDRNLVLLVNYFGFRDPRIEEIVAKLKKNDIFVMEDNAHGFFTWHESKRIMSDLVVFSLHKMFPFEKGGSLIIQNNDLLSLDLSGKKEPNPTMNPYVYRLHEIAEIRKNNFNLLKKELSDAESQGYLTSMRQLVEGDNNIPQTYPIIIKIGDRNKIYQMMNDAGFGVVSLYHTMIVPLQNQENAAAVKLSQSIMNLPVHQDVDVTQYPKMIEILMDACRKTEGNNND